MKIAHRYRKVEPPVSKQTTLASVTRALGRRPTLIVTADQGESLFDEEFLGHGYALKDYQTPIPLTVRGLPSRSRAAGAA